MHAMATQTTAPDPETLEKPKRRYFTAAFKAKILDLTDPVTPGERSKILRKYGLYSSHLTEWRRARDGATLAAMSKKRGPKAKEDPQKEELDRLARENAQLRRKLEVAELIIDVQKKTSLLLGIQLDPTDHLRKD
jgi:transposase